MSGMRPASNAPLMPPAQQWAALAPHPGTIAWRRASDARLLLAAGYALLLQVSHPTVGAGVSEHSQFRRDPWGRLLRTLDYTYTMVYGGPRAAAEMGASIRRRHRRIRGVTPDGRSYHALEPRAYAWVHATLAEAIVRAHDRFARPLSIAERGLLWSEWRALGRLLGIRERDLPADWEGFGTYVTDMVAGTLERTPAVDDVLAALTRPPAPDAPALRAPVWALARAPLGRVLGLATIGLLPPALRGRLGVDWSTAQELRLRAFSAALRSATPLLPAGLQNTGPGYLRYRAAEIARGEVASPRQLTTARR